MSPGCLSPAQRLALTLGPDVLSHLACLARAQMSPKLDAEAVDELAALLSDEEVVTVGWWNRHGARQEHRAAVARWVEVGRAEGTRAILTGAPRSDSLRAQKDRSAA